MAPGALIEDAGDERSHHVFSKNDDAPRSVFPDGIRTSGQHEPLYEDLRPFSDFPQHITGRTVWSADEYIDHPERWVHRFTQAEISELNEAADGFLASGTPLTGISKELFPLPGLSSVLSPLRDDLLNGKGFVLFKNFPTPSTAPGWTAAKTSAAYMGLGAHLGYFVSQNSRGHVLGHVKDVGEDATQIHKTRIYRTAARQFFHADDSDIVGLLCLARAAEGGESDIVSSHAVWNTLRREKPDLAELLTRPEWYFDRKGEVSRGQHGFIRSAVFYLERERDGKPQRLYTKWDPYYVRSLGRFVASGQVPALSDAQQEAITTLEEICNRLALHMVLEVGDVQFLSNAHILHARTAYKDFAPPAPRRHLLRLWLATPEGEGGWALPMPDSKEKKRGGVQVDNNPPTSPLDAE